MNGDWLGIAEREDGRTTSQIWMIFNQILIENERKLARGRGTGGWKETQTRFV